MMMRHPSIISVASVMASGMSRAGIDGEWMPARPMGYMSLRYRLKAAWLVLTGRADALIWPGNQ